MGVLSRVVAVLAALALSAPGVAIGQTSPISDDGAGVSTQPPVQLGGNDQGPGSGPARRPDAPAAGELPNTGSDPRLLFLAGAALTFFGAGLRLRTADAELY